MLMRLIFSLTVLFLSYSIYGAVIELNDGTILKGKIVKQTEHEVVIETAPGMKMELAPSEIKEIRDSGVESIPTPEKIETRQSPVQIPPSAATNTAMANSNNLDDHDAFNRETSKFVDGVRKEITNRVKPEDKQRVDLVRQITSEEANLRITPMKVTYKLLTEAQAEKILTNSRKSIESNRERFSKSFDGSPEFVLEYKLYSLLYDLQQALNMYGGGVAAINYEEQITMRQKISLNDNPSPRGKELRDMMKENLKAAADLRAQISSQYSEYISQISSSSESETLRSGSIVEGEGTHQVKADRALLFAYDDPQGVYPKQGLLEDLRGSKISQAKPVILKKGQRVTFLQSSTVKYPDQELEVSRVKVTSDSIVELQNDTLLPTITLIGWVISDRLEPVK